MTKNALALITNGTTSRHAFFDGQVTRTLRTLKLSEIRPCPYNAHERETKFASIKASISRVGGVLNPIHVWWDGVRYFRIDGAGRSLAAEELGIEEIQAFIYQGAAEFAPVLYAELNGTPRPVTGKQQVETIVNGGPAFSGRSIASEAVKTMRANGTPQHAMLQAPSRVKCAERLRNDLIQFDGWKATKFDTAERLFNAILTWFETASSYRAVNDTLTAGMTAERRRRVLSCLSNNAPYKHR